MSRNLALFEDSSVPQELLDYHSAMDGELKRNPYEVSLAIEKFEKAAINAVNLPRQNVKTSTIDLPTKIPEKFFQRKNPTTRALEFTEQESASEEDYTNAGVLFPSANPLSRAEVKRLQAVFKALLNDLGSFCLPNGNAALSLDQLPDYTNYIMRLHASTDIIFEEVRRQALARSQKKFKALTKVKNIYQEMLKAVADCVTEFHTRWQTEREVTRSAALQVLKRQTQLEYVVRELTQSENLMTQISRAAEEKKKTLKEEVFANELENDHLVHMHSLYHAREERVNAETQASTRKLQKCATNLLFMAGRLSSENCVTSVKKVLNTRLVWSFRWKDLQSLGHSLTSLHLAKLTIDTESIFAILELIHVQMEKIGNYILNSVAVLRNLQRTHVRQDANVEVTDKPNKPSEEAIKIALECERRILGCFTIDVGQVLLALGPPVEAAFSTCTVDSVFTNTPAIQASIHQHLKQSSQQAFGIEVLLEEVKLIALQCAAVLKRMHNLSELAPDMEPEPVVEPILREEQQLPRDPSLLEEYSLVLFRALDFIKECVNRKQQLCDTFKELVNLLGGREPGTSPENRECSQGSALSEKDTAPLTVAASADINRVLQILVDKLREEKNIDVPQVIHKIFPIRQLFQQLSIDLASTRLKRANTFVQLDQDLVKWVFAVLLKLCKVDEYASTRLVGDIEGCPENLDDKTSPRVRSGSSPDNSSTEGLTSPPAPYFSKDQNTDPLPRLQSQADVENCKNQLIERISQSDSVITKYSSCFLEEEKELSTAIQLLQDSEVELSESIEQLVYFTEREDRIAEEVKKEEIGTIETVDKNDKEDSKLMHILASTSLGSLEAPCRAAFEFAQHKIREQKVALEHLQANISTSRSATRQERQRLDDVRSQLEGRRGRLREVTDILLTKQLTLFGQGSSS